jgi:hypothetical protein
MAEACLFGKPLGFPVDTSTRGFRRAASEPRFPVKRFEKDAVVLRDAPIRFHCKTGARSRSSSRQDKEEDAPPPETMTKRHQYDPHRVGFGPLPTIETKVRTPPTAQVMEGIIGKSPCEQTRVKLGLGVGEGENNLGGEKTRDDFPR